MFNIFLSFLFRFVTGPSNLKDEGNLGKIPRVFINTEEDNEECQLLVYKALSASICMLINGTFHVFIF